MQIALFVVLTLIAIGLAFSRPGYLLIFLLVTGPLNLSAEFIEGLGGAINLSSVWLFTLIGSCLVALIAGKGGSRIRWTAFEWLYLAFLGWCGIMGLVSDEPVFALRMILKLVYPFLVMLLAHRFAGEETVRARLFPWVAGSAALAVTLTGGLTSFLAPPIAVLGRQLLYVGYAPFADYTAMMSILALIGWYFFKRKQLLILFALAAISPVFFGIRTGILATAVGVALVVAFRHRLPVAVFGVAGTYLLSAVILFAMPSMKEYMFFQPEKIDSQELILNPQNFSLDQINTHGRLDMWERAMNRLFWPSPLAGSGLGACQALFYSGWNGPMRVVHNEFVRLLCDVGIIGVGLWLAMACACMFSAWRVYRQASLPMIQTQALFVLCAIPALMASMYFDNLIDYVLYAGQYPFAFAGILANHSGVSPDSIPPTMPELK